MKKKLLWLVWGILKKNLSRTYYSIIAIPWAVTDSLQIRQKKLNWLWDGQVICLSIRLNKTFQSIFKFYIFLLPFLLMGKPNFKIGDRDNSFKYFYIQNKLEGRGISIMFRHTEISWKIISFKYLSDYENFVSLINHQCRHNGKWRYRTIESQNSSGWAKP